jgi:hypothetical protein
MTQIVGRTSELERRSPRSDANTRQAGERIKDFLGQTVAKILVFGIRRQIDEWQHS